MILAWGNLCILSNSFLQMGDLSHLLPLVIWTHCGPRFKLKFSLSHYFLMRLCGPWRSMEDLPWSLHMLWYSVLGPMQLFLGEDYLWLKGCINKLSVSAWMRFLCCLKTKSFLISRNVNCDSNCVFFLLVGKTRSICSSIVLTLSTFGMEFLIRFSCSRFHAHLLWSLFSLLSSRLISI